MNQPVFLVAFGLSLLLALGGCGGSDGADTQKSAHAIADGTESQALPLSKAEFVKRASAICTETKERSAAGYREYSQENAVPSSGPGLAAKAAELIETVFVPIYGRQVEEIGALGVPKGDEKEVNAILAAMRKGIEGARKEPLAFIRGAASLNRASKLAVAYGLPACGNGTA